MERRISIATAYLPHIWASAISVERRSDELICTGQLQLTAVDLESERDIFLTYLDESGIKFKYGQQSTSEEAPHLEFANARSDEDLIRFVRKYGPVVASDLVVHQNSAGSGKARVPRWVVTGIQDMQKLRQERSLFASFLHLLSELNKGKKKADLLEIHKVTKEIVHGTGDWPRDYSVEKSLRERQGQGLPKWHFGDKEFEALSMLGYYTGSTASTLTGPNQYDAAHHILCTVINAFPLEVRYVGDYRREALNFGALRYGIRPALYELLRREYLRNAALCLCANDRCGSLFRADRGGQSYCSPLCSRQHRQRIYWQEHGAKIRKQRLKQQRSANARRH